MVKTLQNFKIIHEEKEYWISRSIAVLGIVFVECKNDFYILANKRGKGTPDFSSYWNMPCGYLDYNETAEDAVIREIYEETGLNINKNKLNFLEINSSPDTNKQNVTLRYFVKLFVNSLKKLKLTNEKSEKDEVEKIKLINIKDIDDYNWAFNHKELIEKYSKIIT
jgi:8-oxo-dGTP pyrophosphatase MutT (NUDIX family)